MSTTDSENRKPMASDNNIVQLINNLKRSKNAVVLAHYYTRPEVQDIADFLGDSLALSVQAAKTDADIIVFAGVRFMGETAKVLCPDKKVLLPDMEADCSLARSCGAEDFAAFKALYPDAKVVSYVNTSVEVKALTDICCTSSNALEVVRSFPSEQQLIFAPDRNLGGYIKRMTGRQNMILWDGACHVHEEFSLEGILELKRLHPDAKVLAHPECRQYIVDIADMVGSTAAILDFCAADDAHTYIVATEAGILHKMKSIYPDREFIAAPAVDSTCGCNNCQYMKMVTLEKIYDVLLNETNEVTVGERVRAKAERSIRAMIDLKK